MNVTDMQDIVGMILLMNTLLVGVIFMLVIFDIDPLISLNSFATLNQESKNRECRYDDRH